jgi:hypothetical protein
LQQQRAKQFLRRNRWPAGLGIELLEFRRQRRQRRVDDLADRSQWMIHWHPTLAAHIAEQRLCSRVPTAHRTSPNISSHSADYTPDLALKLDFFRILLGDTTSLRVHRSFMVKTGPSSL